MDGAAMNDMSLNDVAPVLIEITRGDMVESRHRGRVAVVGPDAGVVLSLGDIDGPVFPRSAIKPLQVIPLIESGAAVDFSLTEREIAVGCASHGGEPMHVDCVVGMLRRGDLTAGDLECGGHWPSYGPAHEAMIRQGEIASDVHNNCSGKHAAMLLTAKYMGEDTRGYIELNHPVQQRVVGVLEQLCGHELGAAPRGTDGCGIPTLGIPLGNLALGFARFADPGDEVPPRRADAIRQIRTALAQEPQMIAGTGRYCSDVIRATGGTVIVKTGAEGVFCAAVPSLGLGIALKCEDGAGRASEAMMSAVLHKLGAVDYTTLRSIDRALPQPILNRNRRIVGEIRAVPPLAI